MDVKLNRRDAIKGTLAGAGLLFSEFSGAETKPPMLIQRSIPSTGEKLPVVGLGSWQQFDIGSAASERDPLREVLAEMHKMGGKVIDSSPMYGRSEQVIGDLSGELKINEQFFLATKVWTTGRQEGIDQMNASLRKMGRKQMDLMQIHNLQDWQTHLKTLRDWKEQGKVRYIGITHYTDSAHQRLEEIIRSEKLDFVQFNYSIISRNAEKRLFAAAKERGVAVLINEPFEQGALFRSVKGKQLPGWAAEYDIKSWGQFFLKFIAANDAVTCVIPGTSDVKHLTDNLGAASGKLPNVAGREKMAAFMRSI